MTDPETLAVTIVDGYVDEPAHFGVPPYISTYPRYAAGALVDAGVRASRSRTTRSIGFATSPTTGATSTRPTSCSTSAG